MNPFKRLRRSLGLTMEDVCRGTGVSKSYVIKNEHGGYPEPSEVLLRYYGHKLRQINRYFDETAFRSEYHEWQRYTRQANYGFLTAPFPLSDYLDNLPVGLVPFNDEEPYYHPLEYWRINSVKSPNLNQVSKAFCLHQGLLHKFEQQSHLVNSVPEPFVSALIDSGYSPATLANFGIAFTEFKQYVRNLNLRVLTNGFIRRSDTVA